MRVDREGELPGKLAIYVYVDHPPPHFHAISPDTDVIIGLNPLRILRGRISRRDHAAVMDWATRNADGLWRAWRAMNERD